MINNKRLIYIIPLVIIIVLTLLFTIISISNYTSTLKLLLLTLLPLIGILCCLFINKDNSVINEIVEWISFIILSISVLLFITTFIIFTSKVSGNSMNPTLKNGDRIYIRVFNYEPKKDHLVIYDLEEKNELIVKRVVAAKDDLISYKFEDSSYEMYLVVNGNTVTNVDGVKYYITRSSEIFKKINNREYKLLENEVLLLGDNVDNSLDSRSLGLLDTKNIIGKVIGY